MENALDKTPAPQEIRVALADVTLVVPDISKPVWFGPYYSGKLAVYLSTVEPHTDAPEQVIKYLEDADVYLCTLTETGNADFMLYSPYEKGIDVEAICDHLLENVWNTYQLELKTNNISSYLPESNQVH